MVIPNYRRHDEFVAMWEQSRQEARQFRKLLEKSPEWLREHEDDPDELHRELADRERLEERAAVMLREVRRTLRRAGVLLPDLPRPLKRALGEEDQP
jgi:hypothetical protein